MLKASIVIPAHNEERRIGAALEYYSRYFKELKRADILDYEILVVINNTRDKTESIVQSFQKKNKNIFYLNLLKGGKGFAVIEGFKDALKRDNDIIGFVDADMATLPDEYYKLIRSINGYDGVIASRYIKGAVVRPRNTLPRILASRLYNLVIRTLLLLPFKDTQCGAKIFSRRAIQDSVYSLGMTQLAFDIELIYIMRKRGWRIREVPTVWSNKQYSTINFWNSGPWMTLAVVRLRLLNSPFKWTVRLYDKVLGRIRKINIIKNKKG